MDNPVEIHSTTLEHGISISSYVLENISFTFAISLLSIKFIIGMFIFSIFSFCFSKALFPLMSINFSSLFSIFFAFTTSSLYNNITSLLVFEVGFFCIEIFPFLLSCILSISVRIFLSNCLISSSSFFVSTTSNSNNSICFSYLHLFYQNSL